MSGASTVRVGWVGLGSQGGPMARRVIDAGFETTLWARRAESLEPFGATTAAMAASRAELGAACDVLGVCVVDDAGVDEVLRGADGALASMRDGSVVIVHSTVHPSTCVRLQAEWPMLHVLDAPVSGGGGQAEVGKLLVMVGGPSEVVERCRPLFASFGDPILHVGPLGSGQVAKALNNTAFTAQLALSTEVFAVAREQGLDRAAMAEVLRSASGRSYAAEVVTGFDFDVEGLAPFAGELLAKDVGILADHAQVAGTVLLAAADRALDRMGVSRWGADRWA